MGYPAPQGNLNRENYDLAVILLAPNVKTNPYVLSVKSWVIYAWEIVTNPLIGGL